jgi:hypothetical protein
VNTTLDPRLLVLKAIAVVGFLAYVWFRPSPFLRVVVCFLAEAGYGMVQDQFSVRVCQEYFTVAHARLGTLDDPTLLGIAWGGMAGGSGGLLLGLLLGITATSGRWRPLSVRELTMPLLWFLAGQAVMTAVCGLSAYVNAELAVITLVEPLNSEIPAAFHRRFFALACAHLGTYTAGILGGIGLCAWAVRRRLSSK